MAYTDPALNPYLTGDKAWEYAACVAGALLVLALGKWLGRSAKVEAPSIEAICRRFATTAAPELTKFLVAGPSVC